MFSVGDPTGWSSWAGGRLIQVVSRAGFTVLQRGAKSEATLKMATVLKLISRIRSRLLRS